MSFDLTGGYQAVLIVMVVITVLSMAMAVSIQKPIKSDLK